ncbi:ExeM/NucH family extracellular endonuclease [Cylindrospermopsis raciborskii]|uniref:ExeM/NucH family extracellular endonuclease n=1 Tax=Cylindrospermopsis raciborskii TaxID=77022 RepID=UPI0001C16431|nr:ExeM/NucH family extracellular endonuclease [Cylindrospermopsis raciborskii]EFA68633.1 Endonuclease/exonuclease/phosphatase [Cylindrospermopsis raciborskii CS-505]
MSNTYHNLATGAFTQNWTDTTGITINNDWSNITSIIGYRGDDLTSATGVDPQTVIADGTGVINVIANQSNPNTVTTGGVAEFEISDPVVSLQGSGTADAPFLLIHLNTLGVTNINISYNLRDIDGSTDNAVQAVALQYRIGTTGNFTNIPSGYVADASSGPSLANLVTPVSAILPTEAENQAQLQVRIITTNAPGNDEWIGIDNINIVGTPQTASASGIILTQSGNSTDVAEGGGTDTYSVVLNSQPTANVTIAINAGPQLTTNITSLTFTPQDWNVAQIVTVAATNDATFEGNHTGTLTHAVTSADTNYNSLSVANVTANITDNEAETAPTIQIRITEYMYSGANGEFVELTNIGNTTVDLTDWSYDDNSRIPGSFSLSGFGTVQAGESVIFTEATNTSDFRTAWGLAPSVKVIAGSNQGLGRADEINIYNQNNQRVDRLTYDDGTISGSVRTQNVSAWTGVTNLGLNDATKWQLSTVADAQGSVTSTGGDIGNPGRYGIGTVSSIVLTQTGGNTSVMEGGATDTYTLALTSTPTAPVNINVTVSDGQTLVSTDGVNFGTTAILALTDIVAKIITVRAVDDSIFEFKPHTGAIAHTVTSNDSTYNSLTIPNLNISIGDNDTAPNLPAIRITEYQYDGNGSEFFELTNIGNTAIDLTGWSYDDDSRIAGTVSLSDFGILQAGESVIITEAGAEDFRADWGLAPTVKIIGGLTVNLGREDEINIFNNNGILVDSLIYGDSTRFPSTGRTQNVSAWTVAANLGKNDITQWALSTVSDSLNSYNSLSGGTGNPSSYSSASVPSPAILVAQSGGNTAVTEGGSTDTYTVVLRSQPTANVTVDVVASSQLNVTNTSLTFTPANWNVAQTVTVTGVDDNLFEDAHTGVISHSATSTDTLYNRITIPSVNVNITDNDVAVGAVPSITENTASPLISLATTGIGVLSGVIGDPTDPASTLGIDFAIADVDTSLSNLIVTVSSSNQTVVTNSNLVLSGTDTTRNLRIKPTGVGFADITLTVNDGNNVVTYKINYAASQGSVSPNTTRFHTGTSDASTAIAIDDQYMLVGDDEDQRIRLYHRTKSGAPITSFDFGSVTGLTSEVDLEGSVKIGNRIYWIGSHGNNSSNQDAPNRERLFATTIAGTGVNTTLTFAGYYQFLEDDLIAWDNSNGHGLGVGFLGLAASAAPGVSVSVVNGFNIEGLTASPDGNSLYVAFRTPLEPTGDRTKALIVPVTNLGTILNTNGGTTGSATFGAPIQLDLGGRGIRSIERNSTGQYVIIAGAVGASTNTAPNDFRIYTWTGNPADKPLLRATDLTALDSNGSFEGIVTIPENLTGDSKIQLLVDNGDTFWYGNSTASKNLNQDNWQKFRTEEVTLGPIKIHQIQGNVASQTSAGGRTDISPLNGQTVTIEAIVVGDFQAGDTDTKRNLNGFYVQEEDTDGDGNVLTSEGIFVFDGSNPSVAVSRGDKIKITGTISEFFGETQLTPTTVTIISSGNTLPTAANITLPTPITSLSQGGTPQPDLEAFEGMLVKFTNTLTVTEMFNLDRFNEIKLAQGDRPQQFTQFNNPDVAGYAAHRLKVGSHTITYDDGLSVQNALIGNLDGFGPTFNTASNIRMGDRITDLSGVLSYQWAGNAASGATWRVRSTQDGQNRFTKVNDRPVTPKTVGGSIKVTGFNVLNYFKTIDLPGVNTVIGQDPRGADSMDEFNRQTDKLVTALLTINADVLGLVELENDFLAGSSGNGIEYLTNQLNAKAGAGTYAWVNPGTQFVGSDAIAVGLIYKPMAVSLLGDVAILNSSEFMDPNNTGQDRNRPAVAQTFQDLATNEKFTVVVNHLKSKGASELTDINSPDYDQNDGQGFWNNTRTKAIQALVDWLNTNPTKVNDSDYLLLGDFNAYAQEDPVKVLKNAGYIDLASAFHQGTTASYVFDGQTGTLDYAFASASLAQQVTGATEWAINSDEADGIDYNLDFGRDAAIFDGTTPYRSSDHDPVIVGLNLVSSVNEPPLIISGTSGPDNLKAGVNFAGVNQIIFTGAGSDMVDIPIGGAKPSLGSNSIFTGSGADIISVADGDRAFGGSGDDEFDATEATGYRISGGVGNDIFSLGVNGRAIGGDGDDRFFVGEGGGNIISGGAGADQFWILTDDPTKLKASNTIVDYTISTDVIGIANQVADSVDDLTLSGSNISLKGVLIATLNGVNAASATFVFGSPLAS